MLNENIKQCRVSKGLTQEELAAQLNVVRQTVSKWEKGISVPDAEMLIVLAEKLEVPVSTLLGESIPPGENGNTLKEIAEKLSAINAILARSEERKRKILHAFSWVSVVAAGGYLLLQAVIFAGLPLFLISYPAKEDIGIIGGADGPTAIFLTSKLASSVDIWTLLVIALILVLSIAGVCISRKKHT